MYENAHVRMCARVSMVSWKLLPKYSHERYSQHGGTPNLREKCRSDGNLAVSNYIRRSGFFEKQKDFTSQVYFKNENENENEQKKNNKKTKQLIIF